MQLYTFWLPFVGFNSFVKKLSTQKIKKEQEYNSSLNIRKIVRDDGDFRIIFDSTGFYYIEAEDLNRNIIKQIIEKYVSKRTKDLLFKTLLNRDISCVDFANKNENDILVEFIESILHRVEQFEEIELQSLAYSLFEEPVRYYKLESSHGLINLVNRNFEQLVKKSLFFTESIQFGKNEIYDLSILKNSSIEKAAKKCELTLLKSGEKIDNEKIPFVKDIIKKAIQDSIEEYTILNFLKVSKARYITQIYDKISEANSSIAKLHSQILSIDINSNNTDSTCKIKTEEEIELFTENLLQVVVKFKAVDNKVKRAYYIKIGNVSTETNIDSGETIEDTYFYMQWSGAIEYFESMATNLKEVLVVYHQNKNIKELEDIAYYENYKSDLEDIKDLTLHSQKSQLFSSEQKRYIDTLVLIIALTALAGESPIVDPSHIAGIYKDGSDTLLNFASGDTVFAGLKLFGITFLNFILYFLIFVFIYCGYRIVKHFFGSWLIVYRIKSKIKAFCNYFNKKSEGENIFYFEDSDYDKHEHRSTKPLFSYKNGQEDFLYVEYREYLSASELMRTLKNVMLKKAKGYEYNLFPELLKNPYQNKNFKIRENYRISRKDKVTTKILLRYKIMDLELSDFLKFVRDDQNYLSYYQLILKEAKYCGDTLAKRISKLEKITNLGVKLTFYVVYSFNLKIESHERDRYRYRVVKDQFRVHYHINKLPMENLNRYQDGISELTYIYFLARLKRLDYLLQKEENNPFEDAEKNRTDCLTKRLYNGR